MPHHTVGHRRTHTQIQTLTNTHTHTHILLHTRLYTQTQTHINAHIILFNHRFNCSQKVKYKLYSHIGFEIRQAYEFIINCDV